jgi:hypothetical protein
MELIIHKGRAFTSAGEEPHYAPAVRLDLDRKQAGIVAAALKLALAQIESEINKDDNSDWDGNDLPLIQNAIDQLAEAKSQMTAYDEQTRRRIQK